MKKTKQTVIGAMKRQTDPPLEVNLILALALKIISVFAGSPAMALLSSLSPLVSQSSS